MNQIHTEGLESVFDLGRKQGMGLKSWIRTHQETYRGFPGTLGFVKQGLTGYPRLALNWKSACLSFFNALLLQDLHKGKTLHKSS